MPVPHHPTHCHCHAPHFYTLPWVLPVVVLAHRCLTAALAPDSDYGGSVHAYTTHTLPPRPAHPTPPPTLPHSGFTIPPPTCSILPTPFAHLDTAGTHSSHLPFLSPVPSILLVLLFGWCSGWPLYPLRRPCPPPPHGRGRARCTHPARRTRLPQHPRPTLHTPRTTARHTTPPASKHKHWISGCTMLC